MTYRLLELLTDLQTYFADLLIQTYRLTYLLRDLLIQTYRLTTDLLTDLFIQTYRLTYTDLQTYLYRLTDLFVQTYRLLKIMFIDYLLRLRRSHRLFQPYKSMSFSFNVLYNI